MRLMCCDAVFTTKAAAPVQFSRVFSIGPVACGCAASLKAGYVSYVICTVIVRTASSVATLFLLRCVQVVSVCASMTGLIQPLPCTSHCDRIIGLLIESAVTSGV